MYKLKLCVNNVDLFRSLSVMGIELETITPGDGTSLWLSLQCFIICNFSIVLVHEKSVLWKLKLYCPIIHLI